MIIVFLINNLEMGGAERVVCELANQLIQDDISVEIICTDIGDIAYHLNDKCKVTYLNKKKMKSGFKKLFKIFINSYKLSLISKKRNYQIVQSHLYRSNYTNILSKVLFNSKHEVQVVNHSSCSRYKTQGILGKVNLFLIEKLYKHSDKIVAISKMMAHEIKTITKRRDIYVINNPYSLEEIEKKSKCKVLEFNFNKEKKYLISVGRMIGLKRNIDIVEALNDLDESIELIFLGDGPEKGKLKKLVKTLKLSDRVHFIGRVENPFKFIKRSDVFVNCSRTEGFPNVLIEAMACETFVISSDCISGPREILAPKTNFKSILNQEDNFSLEEYGILYPVANVKALKESINFLMYNVEKKKEIENKYYKYISKYSKEKIIQQYKTEIW